MCEFGIQVSRHWPWTGLPHLALWHHVGVTIGITLDKNGSLYDPAGTESWNMQIRYETTKLTMHPTNNRRSPEWFPCPRASSKNTSATWFWQNNPNTSAAWFGEILQKIKILSATWFRRKYWGRFWCSWTNRKWPTLIPDCDNSAATGQLVQQFKPNSAGTQSWSDSASSTSG